MFFFFFIVKYILTLFIMEVNRKKQEKCEDNKKGKQRGEGSVCLKEEKNHDNNIIYTSREIGNTKTKAPKILSLGHFFVAIY